MEDQKSAAPQASDVAIGIPVIVAPVAPAASAGPAQAEVVARKVARRHLRNSWVSEGKISRAALRMLILKAGLPMLRERRKRMRWVAPRIERGAEHTVRTFIDTLVRELVVRAAALAEHRKQKTMYTEDVCYAATLVLRETVH